MTAATSLFDVMSASTGGLLKKTSEVTLRGNMEAATCLLAVMSASIERLLKKGLTIHLKRRHGRIIKPSSHCSLCDKDFRNLDSHIAIVHEQLKSHNCQLCEYSASNSANLKYHIAVVHENDKPFHCRKCQYKTVSKGHLAMHMRFTHKEKDVKSQENNSAPS